MRYYTYDNNNAYTGFEDLIVEPSSNFTTIEPASDEHTKWNSTLQVWEISNEVDATFEELQQIKITQARQYFDEIVQNSVSNAASFELDTWETQRQEWMRYQDDNTVTTPYCNTLAAVRGITKEALMQKIGDKVVSFAYIQGQLHGLEDIISACTTEEQLDAIVW